MKFSLYSFALAALPFTLSSPTPEGAVGFVRIFTPFESRSASNAEVEGSRLDKRATCYVDVPSNPGFVRCYQSPSLSAGVVGVFQNDGYYPMQCWKYATGYPGSSTNCVSGNCQWDLYAPGPCYVPSSYTTGCSLCTRATPHAIVKSAEETMMEEADIWSSPMP
ncbi:hypothetical protein CC78DRAFT_547789 [Lojkania enalia]|uniref:Uncharacterized protein n=1 Tax=Lojkania enalia TaxID=147567 RepID=A0A9P4K032_9PLEO|nr:hypothetical protein CC78DRAFT_547789 [Didymosphaeria enalia]